MQIVIDIPDEIYKDIESRDWKNTIWARDSLMQYIHEGVVLPKHRGRLIDADAPTIIEADKEVQDDDRQSN